MPSNLISTANLLAYADRLAAMRGRLLSYVGDVEDVDSAVAGTVQAYAVGLRTTTLGLANAKQLTDLLQPTIDLVGVANLEKVLAMWKPFVDALRQHVSSEGRATNASVTTLANYLTYANATPHTAMVTHGFRDLYYSLYGEYLPALGVMSPAIHPVYTSGASANGLAARAIGSTMDAGDDVDTVYYSPGRPILEVTVNFANGTDPPAYTIAGTDNTGATSTTWTATFATDNPTAAVSTTITPSVTAGSRQTVAVASLSGIVAGSVLIVNAGLIDEERIIVESINGGATTLTAVFRVAHAGGAAITGNFSIALTPSVANRRIVHVSGITPTVAGTTAGKVRVVSVPDRVAA